MVDRPVAWH